MKKEISSNYSITINKKKFNRITRTLNGVEKVEWRRYKTGHEVKMAEFIFLENEFSKKNGYKHKKESLKNIREIEVTPVPRKIFDTVKDRDYLLNVINKNIQNGEIIEAIKKIKRLTGVSLGDSKDFVDLCRSIIEVRQKTSSVPSLTSAKRKSLEESLLVQSDNGSSLLKGVKHVKEVTGWGLREAKDFVDDFFTLRKFNDLNH